MDNMTDACVYLMENYDFSEVGELYFLKYSQLKIT